jgi:hypothetical protein
MKTASANHFPARPEELMLILLSLIHKTYVLFLASEINIHFLITDWKSEIFTSFLHPVTKALFFVKLLPSWKLLSGLEPPVKFSLLFCRLPT